MLGIVSFVVIFRLKEEGSFQIIHNILLDGIQLLLKESKHNESLELALLVVENLKNMQVKPSNKETIGLQFSLLIFGRSSNDLDRVFFKLKSTPHYTKAALVGLN
jgi:hypothetical protein